MDPKNKPRPLTEADAIQEATVKYLMERYPKMSEDKVNLWVKAMAYEGAKPEAALKERIETARSEFRSVFGEGKEAYAEKILSELKKFRDYMRSYDHIMQHKEEITKLVAFFRENKAQIPTDYLAEIQSRISAEFLTITRSMNRINRLIPLILLFASDPRGDNLVEPDPYIAETLELFIREGRLNDAKVMTASINRCGSYGFRGNSYLDALKMLPHYTDTLKKGYERCLRDNDWMGAFSYQTEAQENGVDMKEVEETVQTKLDTEAMARGEFPSAA